MATDPIEAANQRIVDIFASKLRRRQVVGSRRTALETTIVLRQIITKARFTSFDQLVNIIRAVGRKLVDAQPNEHAVGNTVRKILRNLREEYQTAMKKGGEVEERGFSISNFVRFGHPRSVPGPAVVPPSDDESEEGSEDEDDEDTDDTGEDPDSFAHRLKPVFMAAIQDVFDELDTVYDGITKNARDHIHSDEIILTLTPSQTITSFLKSAAHYREFTALLCSSVPDPTTAQSLSLSGINTFLIPPSSIHTLISRANKVILPAHTILANGGILTPAGGLLIAMAAREYATPLVVVAGQFKITPNWGEKIHEEFGSLDLGDPREVLYGEGEDGSLVDKVDVINPRWDYVRPELIQAFITNDGDHPPASIYRLLKEAYHEEDYVL